METKRPMIQEETGRGRRLAARPTLPAQACAHALLDMYEILVSMAIAGADDRSADKLLAWSDEHKPTLREVVRRGR